MSKKGKALTNSLIILFSFLAMGPLVSIGVSKLGIARDKFFFDEPVPFLAFLVVPAGLLLIIRGLLSWRRESWSDIGLAKPGNPGRLVILTALLVALDLAVVFGLGPLIYAMFGASHDLSYFNPLVGNMPGLIGILIFAWVMGAMTEETLFRGYLMTNLAAVFGDSAKSWWVAALVVSFLFAVPHLYQGLGGAIQTGMLSFVSAAVFIKGGKNLWPLILAHGLVNSASFISIYLGYGWA